MGPWPPMDSSKFYIHRAQSTHENIGYSTDIRLLYRVPRCLFVVPIWVLINWRTRIRDYVLTQKIQNGERGFEITPVDVWVNIHTSTPVDVWILTEYVWIDIHTYFDPSWYMNLYSYINWRRSFKTTVDSPQRARFWVVHIAFAHKVKL